jgi:hypothetical protein
VLRDIRLIYQYGYWHVVLGGSESMPYKAFKVGEPLRLVAELPNTVNKTGEKVLVPKNEIIDSIVTSMPPQNPQPFTRVHIDSVIMEHELRFFILANGSLSDFNVFHLPDPPRVICDFMGVRSAEIPNAWSTEGPMVKHVRVAQYADKVRVIFELIPKRGLPYRVIPADDRVEVSFTPGSGFPPFR